MVALIIHSIKLNVLFAMAEDDFGLSVFIFERERERERERETTVKYLRQFHFLTSILEDPNCEYTNTEHIP
jgi:hypothetical protein